MLDITGNINYTGKIYNNGTEVSIGLQFSNGTSGIIYYNGGKVGIGTNTPNALFKINNSSITTFDTPHLNISWQNYFSSTATTGGGVSFILYYNWTSASWTSARSYPPAGTRRCWRTCSTTSTPSCRTSPS